MTNTVSRDFTAIKARQQEMWASGDYAVLGTKLQPVGESLCDAVDVCAGWRVLDVAAGNGNAALAAARRGCQVTAGDYVPELLERARLRAEADGLTLATRVADAEDLPFADATFDAVLSTFGVMFAPDQARAAAELVRVCRPGGRIGLANWTPDGFIGRMLKTVGQFVPPPVGVASPLLWGSRVDELLGDEVDVTITPRQFTFRFRSAQDLVDTFATFYGPLVRALASLDDARSADLRAELLALASAANRSGDALLVDSEYLEVVAVRRTGGAK